MASIRWLDKNFEYVVLAVLLAVLTVLSFSNVVLRYCFASSIIWADEICRFALVLSGFFSIPCWVRNKTGIRVDALLLLLPPKLRSFFEYVTTCIMIALFAYLLKGTGMVIASAVKINLRSPSLELPMACMYEAIRFAFLLSLFRLFQALVLQVKSDFNPAAAKDEGVSA